MKKMKKGEYYFVFFRDEIYGILYCCNDEIDSGLDVVAINLYHSGFVRNRLPYVIKSPWEVNLDGWSYEPTNEVASEIFLRLHGLTITKIKEKYDL